MIEIKPSPTADFRNCDFKNTVELMINNVEVV